MSYRLFQSHYGLILSRYRTIEFKEDSFEYFQSHYGLILSSKNFLKKFFRYYGFQSHYGLILSNFYRK